jgi:hypothetical protein
MVLGIAGCFLLIALILAPIFLLCRRSSPQRVSVSDSDEEAGDASTVNSTLTTSFLLDADLGTLADPILTLRGSLPVRWMQNGSLMTMDPQLRARAQARK